MADQKLTADLLCFKCIWNMSSIRCVSVRNLSAIFLPFRLSKLDKRVEVLRPSLAKHLLGKAPRALPCPQPHRKRLLVRKL